MIKLLVILTYYNNHNYSRSPNSEFDNTYGQYIVIGVLVFFIGFVVWMIARQVARYTKKQKVKVFIADFKKNDPFWNEKTMQDAASEIFRFVQKAWLKRNFYYVTGMITDELEIEWEKRWAEMQKKGHIFHIGKLEIQDVIIVGAQDHSVNNKDSFTAEITANLIRYIYDTNKRTPLNGHYNGKALTTDIYVFRRQDNKWLLDKMEMESELSDAMLSKIKKEVPGKPKGI